jgi:hypothetical protein
MSWVDDLVSASGLPAGAATLAVAMYAACTAAEKAARPEALAEIANILKDTSWGRSARPSSIIQRIFVLTFADRHFSWKCARRSMGATIAVNFALTAVLYLEGRQLDLQSPIYNDRKWLVAIHILFVFTFIGFIPDYIALLKTRALLWVQSQGESTLLMIMLLGTDVILSIAISIAPAVAVISAMILAQGGSIILNPILILEAIYDFLSEIVSPLSHGSEIPVYLVYLGSTVFTSVWTALVLSAAVILKLLSPVQRFTRWFFDVDKHPIQAIAIIAGTLSILCSAIWSITRNGGW